MNTNFGTYDWDASTNNLNINFMDEFFNTLPISSLQNRTINFNPFTDQIQNTRQFLQGNSYKKVTKDKVIENIKKIKYENDFHQKECPIMMVEFEEGEEISQLPCNHLFNTEALTRWLKNESYKCPICRHELEFKEVKIRDTSDNDLSGNDTMTFDDLLDLSNNDLSGVGGLDGLRNLSNVDFETLLINMIQTEIRRNSVPNTFNSFIEEVETSLDSSYDEELQQALWDSIHTDD